MNSTVSTFQERVAWILLGLGLLFALLFHLVPGLLAGLLVYSLIHRLDLQLHRRRWTSKKNARLAALGILIFLGLILASGLAIALLLAWKARSTVLPDLLTRMAHMMESTRTWLGNRWISEDFINADSLRVTLAQTLQNHAAWLRTAGGYVGRVQAHLLAGLVIGVLAAFHHPSPDGLKPLAAALAVRLQRLLTSFEAVVYAQLRISLINTALSALYLFAVLPLLGVKLPLRLTLVAVTFAAGLLPVLGNVLSNTAVVVISLDSGPGVAVASLIYLVVIHKLEYFLNARIVGERIHAQAWEVLLSMVLMEIAFGIPGLVLAPILYAYIKGELMAREWV